MRVKPLQIHWHDKQPIYSAHFEPGPKGRLATAGGDGNVRIWKVVKDKEKDSTHVEFLSSLNRHTAAVNVVRFSPTAECLASAGDDGNIILWRPTESKEAVSRFAESDDEEFERETWRVQSMMRGSLSDIYDLAWSPDGRYIISGSIDNTARIWDVRDAKCIHVLADHHHYVQGVAWDPLGEFVATQSSDRTVHIYAFKVDKNGHVTVTKIGNNIKLDLSKLRSTPQQPPSSSVPAPSESSTEKDTDKDKDKDDAAKTTKSQPKSFRLYHDETLTSFFRRLSFTPDGAMLLTPSGQYKAPAHKPIKEDEATPGQPTPLDFEIRNTAYIYARRNFNKGPIAHLPGHKKPSVAIKCSPILYELRKVQPPSANSDYRPTASSTTASTPGAPTTSEKAQEAPKIPSVFGLGYRSVYAVATQDSVLIYDTQQTAALALVSHLHYATFTDMTWSSDGCNLILTSSDGFCSIISFDEGELGAIYTPPPSMIALLPTSESGLSSALTAEPLDVSAAVAATAGMLQKLNGLSLTEQKAKGKQGDKNESTPETGKKGGKKASKAARSTASAAAAAAATATATAITPASSAKTSSAPSSISSPKASGKLSFKTERDGDSVMGAVQEPTPKKRRIQPFFVSPLPGSSSPGTSQSSSQGSTATPSPALSSSPAPSPAMASTSLFATPGTTSAPEAKPKKRIQPTFVSALPGH
ncbi:MAG: WD40-repeat-containing domain protein [Podila humilis]|nr:MAG: WD40-repeat-containing domain protein [Podila humilis]